MRLKYPPQPLVFCFSGATPLCSAVAKLYEAYPDASAFLCLYNDKYYMAVFSDLKMRCRVRNVGTEYGACLGSGSVMYSYYEEHGKGISRNAIYELGSAFCKTRCNTSSETECNL